LTVSLSPHFHIDSFLLGEKGRGRKFTITITTRIEEKKGRGGGKKKKKERGKKRERITSNYIYCQFSLPKEGKGVKQRLEQVKRDPQKKKEGFGFEERSTPQFFFKSGRKKQGEKGRKKKKKRAPVTSVD